MNVLENIKQMREKAKQSETKYYKPKGGKNMKPSDFNEGKTEIRVAPSHDPKFPLPFVPFRSTYLEVELGIDKLASWNLEKLIKDKSLFKQFGVEKFEDLSEWDDDKLKSKLKDILGDSFQMKVHKKVFIATMHGKEGSKDLLEEYIKFVVTKVNSETGDRDESRKKLSPIFGYRGKEGWVSGINPGTNFVFYGWDWSDKSLYKIEIYGNMMDRIEELYIKFDTPEDPLVIDPFSDESEGIAIQFDKYKNDKGKWAFRIDDVPFNSKKFKSYQEFTDGYKLDEEQLKQLKEVDSLHKSFGRGSFKKSDFELQLNGLILFDVKHEYNAFENDDFMSIVQELAELYEGEEEQEQSENKEVEEVKSGSDIDKVFAQKQLGLKKDQEPIKEEVVDDEEAELKAALALIAKNKANKAAQKKKDDPLKNQKIEENSFKDESAKSNESDGKLNSKLTALRAQMNKKK